MRTVDAHIFFILVLRNVKGEGEAKFDECFNTYE